MTLPEDHSQAMLRNLHEHTGRSLGNWLALIREEQPENMQSCVQWLKERHRLGHFYATFIALEAFRKTGG